MISRFTAFLSVLTGLTVGSPIARHAPVPETAFDVGATNVFYDLACLKGDANGDGKLSDSEYSSFRIDSLAPSSSRMEDEDFRFLGFLPADRGRMFFYTWTPSSLEDSSASYLLSYRDSVTPLSSGDGYANDNLKYAQSVFVNQYSGTTGYFTKFRFDYAYPSQDTYRIKAEHFTAEAKGSRISQDIVRDGELFFDSSYTTENAVSLYFGKDTYPITGIIDGYLAVEDQTSSWIYCPVTGGDGVNSALELSYFFFNFDDKAFSVDDIESVSYQGKKRTYTAHLYSHGYSWTDMDSGAFDFSNGVSSFYTGTYRDLVENPGNASLQSRRGEGNKEYATYKDYASDVSVEAFQGTTEHGIRTIMQKDTVHVIFSSEVIRRQSSFDSIVKIADVDSKYPGDEYSNFRNFIKESDHTTYTWAYLVSDAVSGDSPSDTRTKLDHSQVKEIERPLDGSIQRVDTIWETKTLCHDYEEVVTLFMHVVKDDQHYRISVINNPQSVRKYFLVGYPAPTIADIIGIRAKEWWEDIAEWFGKLWEKNRTISIVILAVIAAVIFLFVCGLVVRLVRWAKGGSRNGRGR